MRTKNQQFSAGLILICSFSIFVLAQCTGPQGEPGRDGLDGINYIHSAIYDVNASEWSGNADGYRVVLEVPEITDNIYYDGAVLVYKLFETAPKSFNLLPYTYVNNGLTVYMDFDAYVGSIDLIYKEVLNGVNDTPAPDGLMSFKVVIIEGLPLATLKKMVNVNDFGAVSKLLNIEKWQN
jgi:hypothetical protein